MVYTIYRHPTTRLGRLMMATTVEKILQLCDEFLPGDPPEYFFDRNPVNFPTILNMYRTDKFHMIESGCALVFQKDLEYWAVDEYSLEPCCALKYFPEVRPSNISFSNNIATVVLIVCRTNIIEL